MIIMLPIVIPKVCANRVGLIMSPTYEPIFHMAVSTELFGSLSEFVDCFRPLRK